MRRAATGPLMTETQAAEFLAVSVRTLQDWRYKGVGPACLHLGRAVRYDQSALLDWLNASNPTTGRRLRSA